VALFRRQPVRDIATRSGQRHLIQVPQVGPVLPGWRTYAVTALGPNRDDGPLHLTVYDRIDDLPDGPLAA
jgi:hypothetical protein